MAIYFKKKEHKKVQGHDNLYIDDWFLPNIGELCLVLGRLTYVIDIEFHYSTMSYYPFKDTYMFKVFGEDQMYSRGLVERVYVQDNSEFIFDNKIFKFTKPICADEIKKVIKKVQKFITYDTRKIY